MKASTQADKAQASAQARDLCATFDDCLEYLHTILKAHKARKVAPATYCTGARIARIGRRVYAHRTGDAHICDDAMQCERDACASRLAHEGKARTLASLTPHAHLHYSVIGARRRAGTRLTRDACLVRKVAGARALRAFMRADSHAQARRREAQALTGAHARRLRAGRAFELVDYATYNHPTRGKVAGAHMLAYSVSMKALAPARAQGAIGTYHTIYRLATPAHARACARALRLERERRRALKVAYERACDLDATLRQAGASARERAQAQASTGR